jgi:hypothetical protein
VTGRASKFGVAVSVCVAAGLTLAISVLVAAIPRARAQSNATLTPTFYRDVTPILQQHCQSCHRPGQVAPMSLITYDETKSQALAVATAAKNRAMPPWFADPHVGLFANDPSLTPREIETLVGWANAGAPSGDSHDAPAPVDWAATGNWRIAPPDLVVTMPKPVELPADGEVEYTYEIVPSGFTEGKWVQMSEVRPSSPENVHHAVVYVRPPDSKWLRHAPVGVPFTASDMTDEADRTGRTATSCWCTRREVRRTSGPRGSQSTFRRDRTSFSRCTTRRTGSPRPTGRAWEWCLRRRRQRSE